MLALLSYITINIDPVLVKVGPFSLRWYALMYLLAILVGMLVMVPYARSLGITSEQIWNVAAGVVIAGLIGGRLYYIVQNDPGHYANHPGDIIALWQGGMAFFGAVILGVPTLLVLARIEKVPLGLALDCAAIFAPLAQAVGRIGNLINGDIVGYQSNLPWAVKYINPNNTFAPRDPYGNPVVVQPAAAYEFLFCLGLFAVLWPLRNKLKPAGMLFVLYLSLYCVGQFILFIWRDNNIVAFGLKQAQITAVVVQALLVLGAYFMLLKPWVFDPAYDLGEDEDEEEGYEDDEEGEESGDGKELGEETAVAGSGEPGAQDFEAAGQNRVDDADASRATGTPEPNQELSGPGM
jgi:phosphatidylglycerol:prolipoprotein diacylglycerol transferase